MSERRDGDDRRDDNENSEERRMGDRRDSHRIPLQVEVKEGNSDFEEHAGNISIGGVFFEKPLELPIGSGVKLKFTLPNSGKDIAVDGEVVEITAVGSPEEKGTRVRFKDLDLKSEILIARYLDQNPEE